MPHSALEHYWSGDFLAANAFIGLHLVGALLLGMLAAFTVVFGLLFYRPARGLWVSILYLTGSIDED